MSEVFAEITSSKLYPRGLIELLFRWTFRKGFSSTLFHLGMIGAILTAVLLEFSRWINLGWALTWTHGLFGLLVILGGIPALLKCLLDKYSRLVYGMMLFIDFILLCIVMFSGFMITLTTLGMIPPTPTPWPMIHVLSAYIWILVSLLGNGAIRHAFATLILRLKGMETENINLLKSACAKCGRCVEACVEFTGRAVEDSPAYKTFKLLENYGAFSKKPISNELIDAIRNDLLTICTWCQMCTSVCPIAWNRTGLIRYFAFKTGYVAKEYKTMLKQVYETGSAQPLLESEVKRRLKLKLPEIPAIPIKEYKVIMDETNFSRAAGLLNMEGEKDVS
ncbi:MAG TPA: hypothetical protein ENF33_00475 [Nitrososphaeria archaeon]|nr:MAG: hypothetical protein DRN68_03715 [Nitrososphaerota archaeon]HDJ66178.1 hypothetical protein [Nitrososphaeria archaeon]